MIGRARRRPAVAESPQVGRDDREVVGESWRYPVPHQVRFGDAVQQQDRRTLPAPAPVDRGARRRDIECFEPFKHQTRPTLPDWTRLQLSVA